MGKYLTKREFEYKRELFEALKISEEEAVGKSFEQLSNLIKKNYKKLSLQYHPDKNGGSDEKMKALNEYKSGVISYIIPLKLNGGLIITQESRFFQKYAQITEATKRGEEKYNKRFVAHLLYSCGFIFVALLRVASFIYLAVKFCQNTQLDLKNVLFGVGLASFVAVVIGTSLLQNERQKVIKNLQEEAKSKEETLTTNDLFLGLEKALKDNNKYGILNTTLKFLLPLSIMTMAAALITESALSDFKTVDTKLLIGLSLLVLSFGLQYLADEIYERKVVNLVKEERIGGKLDDVTSSSSFGGCLQYLG